MFFLRGLIKIIVTGSINRKLQQISNQNLIHFEVVVFWSDTLFCVVSIDGRIPEFPFWGTASSCLVTFIWIFSMSSNLVPLKWHLFFEEESVARGEVWGIWLFSYLEDAVDVQKSTVQVMVTDGKPYDVKWRPHSTRFPSTAINNVSERERYILMFNIHLCEMPSFCIF